MPSASRIRKIKSIIATNQKVIPIRRITLAPRMIPIQKTIHLPFTIKVTTLAIIRATTLGSANIRVTIGLRTRQHGRRSQQCAEPARKPPMDVVAGRMLSNFGLGLQRMRSRYSAMPPQRPFIARPCVKAPLSGALSCLGSGYSQNTIVILFSPSRIRLIRLGLWT